MRPDVLPGTLMLTAVSVVSVKVPPPSTVYVPAGSETVTLIVLLGLLSKLAKVNSPTIVTGWQERRCTL